MLLAYTPTEGEEARMYDDTLDFIVNHESCFERTLAVGHVTASGWVVSPGRDKALLMHHRKLDRWFQPGGHCDGDADVMRVAEKEVREETGLLFFKLVRPAVFDLDVHQIPANPKDQAHYHYDIRFLFEADPDALLAVNGEAKSLEWIALDQIAGYNNSESIMRMVRKSSL
ncbi:hypothetical protein DYBT9275_00828 [Dyadobacter sp. CECT 9275]|uniref:Nudix hydrolase domain-containing protein n=2 Tax=Dyadobacter helix TaxID=2822344 RepID=A0A916JCE6_9BACT|nr:hypothetical protein DYBT9275_00828 [Dyadobacter sp. CECT 9275]